MQSDDNLCKFIPKTIIYNKSNLIEMLNSYCLIFVKPDRGRKGLKVAGIKRYNEHFIVHYNCNRLLMKEISNVNDFVKVLSGGKKFLIQQGIDVLQINERPFNLRIWVQKPYNAWEITGITAVLAAPKRVVTNYRQGGTLLPFKEVINKTGADFREIKELTSMLYHIGDHTAKVLNKEYSNLRELGIDIGLDQRFWPWIIEVNTKPRIIIGNAKILQYHRIIIDSLI
ncbi:YheC/YheD family protein [Candidatus Contubernalis alkalaceticus]|nr:YheC/YheD family protein [Candidatus Contubernalis alkalaceticus]UNC92240.1 YheC/YheD family protein [Candidatus Contubernalis alkalaceticus]